MPNQGKIRALAASLRLPNLPSVWSNTLTGVAFACLIQDGDALSDVWKALVTASALYFSGNLLNDWFDIEWDRKNRPERALPRALFTPSLYRLLAGLLVAIALTSATLANPAVFLIAAALIVFILLYTWAHKRTAWSVIPMALCRACLPLLGYFCCIGTTKASAWICLPAALHFAYLLLLSLRARTESRTEATRTMGTATSIALILPPCILVFAYSSPQWWLESVAVNGIATLPYLIWITLTLTLFRRPIARQVSALLAGIPLIDAMILLPYLILGHILLAGSGHVLIATAWAPAFLFGRLLQRYVPAT
jgi:4-hydroxybenzoate polyprenyltransferase